MVPDFHGNRGIVEALEQAIAGGRIPQTMLFAGPEGVGKATLARRFAARLLGGADKIGRDDLSLSHNADYIAEREKWPAEQRNQDPLLFCSHPDFVTFPPDGPLRQISLPQMRFLKERAQFRPLKGERRVFLIDQIDRAGEQAANSLLKTLEEPPEYLILIMTAANPYDLLPTIRSRAVWFQFAPLSDEEMRRFLAARELGEVERRVALARGSPGVAVSVDLAAYERGRAGMMALLKAASGAAPFENWLRYAESAAARKDRLEDLLRILYVLLEDLLWLRVGENPGQARVSPRGHPGLSQDSQGPPVGDRLHRPRGDGVACPQPQLRNTDLRAELDALAGRVSFAWLRRAVEKVDELAGLLRRNIQKNLALDALILELRSPSGSA